MAIPSSKLLRTIIDSVPLHLHIARADTGNISWASARTLAYRGQTFEEYCRHPFDKFHADDKPVYKKAWKAARKTGESLSLQVRIQRFDGVYRFFIVRAVPLRDAKGTIVHWFGTSLDIHEQRLAEYESMRQSEKLAGERKYRLLAESSPLIVFAARPTEGIVYTNNQWSDYSGQATEDAAKFGFLDHLHPDDRLSCVMPPLHETTDTRFSTEVRLRNSAGEYRWHLVRTVCVDKMDDNNGSTDAEVTWLGTCTDINDHKVAEGEITGG